MIGDAAGTSGFPDYSSLKLTDAGEICSAPVLQAHNAQPQLFHEGSIGTIDQEMLSYLIASGMGEDQARDYIIWGCLHCDEQWIPEPVCQEALQTIAAPRSGAL